MQRHMGDNWPSVWGYDLPIMSAELGSDGQIVEASVSPWTESWRWACAGPCPSLGSHLRFCCRRARRGRRWSRACRHTAQSGWKFACERNHTGVCPVTSVTCLPAVFENKQDVVSEGVPVLLQDPTHVVQHLQQQRSNKDQMLQQHKKQRIISNNKYNKRRNEGNYIWFVHCANMWAEVMNWQFASEGFATLSKHNPNILLSNRTGPVLKVSG